MICPRCGLFLTQEWDGTGSVSHSCPLCRYRIAEFLTTGDMTVDFCNLDWKMSA
jgi:hypothetical protein